MVQSALPVTRRSRMGGVISIGRTPPLTNPLKFLKYYRREGKFGNNLVIKPDHNARTLIGFKKGMEKLCGNRVQFSFNQANLSEEL